MYSFREAWEDLKMHGRGGLFRYGEHIAVKLPHGAQSAVRSSTNQRIVHANLKSMSS